MIAIAIAWFLLGLLLLALGGDSIVKAVSGLAQRFGASPFTAGLLLLGVTTSLPELAVNARALAVGQPELALGNAVGSSIVNLGLTLAVAAMAAPLLLRARLQTVLWWSLLAAGVLLILFGLDGGLARWEGGILLAGFIVVQVLLLRRGRSESAEVQVAIAESALSRTSLPLNVLRVLIAALTLYWGARLVVGAAADFGAALGWTPLLVGLLPVAIGTALPEVATAIAAARRGHGDMVLGHVLGSSVVNLLLVIGAMAVLQPLALPASFVRLELPALLAFALVLYPMLRGDLKISRGEGVILLVAFVGWFVLELLLGGAAGGRAARWPATSLPLTEPLPLPASGRHYRFCVVSSSRTGSGGGSCSSAARSLPGRVGRVSISSDSAALAIMCALIGAVMNRNTVISSSRGCGSWPRKMW